MKKSKQKNKTPLEVRLAQTIQNGGRVVVRRGYNLSVYNRGNVPRTYEEAVSSGLNFYIDEEN